MAIDGHDIAAVGAQSEAPRADDFDEVIDVGGCIVLPGLINMHQHHWYTLFKGLADGYLLEDWVTDILLPLSRNLTEDAMRVSSTVAGDGNARDRHDLLVQPLGDDHDARHWSMRRSSRSAISASGRSSPRSCAAGRRATRTIP